MAESIANRLRIIHCTLDDTIQCGVCLPCEAAEEIENLQKENNRLQEIVYMKTAEIYKLRDVVEKLTSKLFIDDLNKFETTDPSLWILNEDRGD